MIRGWELGAGAALGLLAGLLLWGGSPDPPADPGKDAPPAAVDPVVASVPAAATREIERLRSELAREVASRVALETQLAQLEPAPPLVDEAEAEAETAETGGASDGWIDEKLLRRAGFADSVLEELRERFEAIELERLYIRDKATREGWVGKPRFRRRMQELNAKYSLLRDEYGDEAYDWILYSSRRSNRIAVSRVMAGSAADEVGLEVGDVVLRYDEERIFGGHELQAATAADEPGETTPIEVSRDGEPLRFFVPRGPLGVGLDVRTVEPDPL